MNKPYLGTLKEFLNLEPLEQLPEEATISEDQFEVLFQEWIETQGENQGCGLFGKWAWHAGKKDHLRMELYNLGVKIEDVSTNQQSSLT